jgi:hypothetical protein
MAPAASVTGFPLDARHRAPAHDAPDTWVPDPGTAASCQVLPPSELRMSGVGEPRPPATQVVALAQARVVPPSTGGTEAAVHGPPSPATQIPG